MNLEYKKVSFFELNYNFHDIQFFLDAPVCIYIYVCVYGIWYCAVHAYIWYLCLKSPKT